MASRVERREDTNGRVPILPALGGPRRRARLCWTEIAELSPADNDSIRTAQLVKPVRPCEKVSVTGAGREGHWRWKRRVPVACCVAESHSAHQDDPPPEAPELPAVTGLLAWVRRADPPKDQVADLLFEQPGYATRAYC